MFRDLRGPRGEPLLYEEDVYGHAVYEAQARLAEKLNAQPEVRLQRFSRSMTEKLLGRARDSFQIHRGKLMDVLHFLEPRGLAWAPMSENRAEWIAVHPDLGTAIMSFIAIGIAEAKGLDIVTDSNHAHLAVATHDENLVFEELMRGRRPARSRLIQNASDKVDELVQVVMRSCFDVSKLTPRQIADLINDGKDLRRFKDSLVPIAESIPDIADEHERKKRFDAAAADIIKQWKAYKKSLPRFAVDAIVSASNVKPPEMIATLTGGLSGHYLVGIEGALVLGFVIHAGLGVLREWKEQTNSPLRYLSRIHKAGAELTIAR